MQGGRREAQLDAVRLEQRRVLLDEGVARLREDGDEVRERERVERRDDGDAAQELGDQAVVLEIAGDDGVEGVRGGAGGFLGRVLEGGAESDRGARGEARVDDLFEPDKGPGEDEEDVGCVDGVLLCFSGLLPAAATTPALHAVQAAGGRGGRRLVAGAAVGFRRHRDRGAFDHLQEALLHALAAHVAAMRHDGRLGELVDLIEEDDARLALGHRVAAREQQPLDRGLDVGPDVAGLRQGRAVDRGEGHLEDAGERR